MGTVPYPTNASATLMQIAGRHLLRLAPPLLIILGVKLALIQQFGSVTPYWDQWDAEGALLYKPYLEGALGWSDFLASHNEHRIVFTRVLALLEFEAFGLWFPQLQMSVNAVLHVAVLAFLSLLLLRTLNIVARQTVLLTMVVLLSIPFAWENTLAGFQSQFYFVLGFSTASLWLFQQSSGLSARWFAGLLLSVAAYFSMASGVMALVAAVSVYVLQIILRRRSLDARELVSILIMLGILALELHYTRDVEAHDALKAQSALEFLRALFSVAGWPFGAWAAPFVNLPVAILALRIIIKPPGSRSHEWLLLALIFWLGTQWLTLAYGRAAAPTSSRYIDVLVLGPILNVAVLAFLLQAGWSASDARPLGQTEIGRRKRVLALLGAAGVVAIVALLRAPGTMHAVAETGERYRSQTENVRNFVSTGDIASLTDKPYLHVPYPDPNRLAGLLRDPSIRSVLHPAITGQPPRGDLLLPHWLTYLMRAATLGLLRSGEVIAGIGIGMWAAAYAVARRNGGTMRSG